MKDRCEIKGKKRLNHKLRLILSIFSITTLIATTAITITALSFQNNTNAIKTQIHSFDEQINKFDNDNNIKEVIKNK